jgi:hypothetical protein
VKKLTTVCVLVALLVTSTAHADDAAPIKIYPYRSVGLLTVLSGLLITVLAYKSSCPDGYKRDTVSVDTTDAQGNPISDQQNVCVPATSNSPDVNPSFIVSLAHPSLLYAGVGTMGAGLVLVFLPKRVARLAPSISVTPQGWAVSKTIAFR